MHSLLQDLRFAARRLIWKPILLSSLFFRLCVVLVVAFGSRPFGVQVVEREQAPLIIGLRASDAPDVGTSPEQSQPLLGIPARNAGAIRGTTQGIGSLPPVSAAEALAPQSTLVLQRGLRAPRERRTPCAACGDGSPYDATAPPESSVIVRA